MVALWARNRTRTPRLSCDVLVLLGQVYDALKAAASMEVSGSDTSAVARVLSDHKSVRHPHIPV